LLDSRLVLPAVPVRFSSPIGSAFAAPLTWSQEKHRFTTQFPYQRFTTPPLVCLAVTRICTVGSHALPCTRAPHALPHCWLVGLVASVGLVLDSRRAGSRSGLVRWFPPHTGYRAQRRSSPSCYFGLVTFGYLAFTVTLLWITPFIPTFYFLWILPSSCVCVSRCWIPLTRLLPFTTFDSRSDLHLRIFATYSKRFRFWFSLPRSRAPLLCTQPTCYVLPQPALPHFMRLYTRCKRVHCCWFWFCWAFSLPRCCFWFWFIPTV